MNQEKRQNNLIKTFVASTASILTASLLNLIITPYITDCVGTEAYGFVSLAKQFVIYASLLTVALNSFAVRYISMDYHKNRYDEANCFFNSVFWGDLLLIIAISIVLSFCLFVMDGILKIPDYLVFDVRILFIIVFFNFFITTIFTAFSASAYIADKLYIVAAANCIGYVIEGGILFLFFKFISNKVYYVGLAMVPVSLIIGLTDLWICKKYTPELSVKKDKFDRKDLRTLLTGGIWTSVNSAGEILNNGLDLLVCNLMLSSMQMGQLAITRIISTMFQKIYLIVDKPFQPVFLKYYANDDKEGLLEQLLFSMKISSALVNIGFSCICSLGLVFYRLWIPNQDTELIYYLTVIGLLTTIPGGSMHPLYYIYILTVKKVIPAAITIIGGLLNVAAMYLLIKYTNLGIYSIVWTTVVVMYIINFITNPIYMAYVLHFKWYVFYPTLLRNTFSCFVMVMICCVLESMIRPIAVPAFIMCAVLFAFLGAGLHFLIAFSNNEKERIIKYVLKVR
ncbi:lipopolysaccharide biosynthesis protein [Butyrivibrio sp. AD3002]|uniref:lipopolysaccharide biosynthesis protein n=1 Tax=Butyrivibrio sp. AD3002 TaxID=1280670 RepID=UPI0003B5FA54|nr:oligosaccharide flippase family protein [Butyrivibrio sp. AD3002]